MRNLLRIKSTLLLLLFSFAAFAQQHAAIKGEIVTSDGQPAVYVSITLTDKNQAALSNDKGEYTFARIKPGIYTLKVSAVGIYTQEKTVTVAAGENKVVNFTLKESNEILKEVTIAGKKTNTK